MSKKILVFGATGGTGRQLVDQALELGYDVTAFVRDTLRLERNHAHLHVVHGDMLDAESVDSALAHGFDAVISALGTYHRKPNTDLSEGTSKIVSAMQRHGVRRLLVVSSLGSGDSAGQGNFWARLVQRLFIKEVLADKTRQESVVQNSNLEWTIVRPPQLLATNRVCDDLVTWSGPRPPKKVTWKVTRASLAKFLLDTLEASEHSGAAVNISDPA